MQEGTLQRKILKIICQDGIGLIAKITNICYQNKLNILENNEFIDHYASLLFMRTELEGVFYKDIFLTELYKVLPKGFICELHSLRRRKIIVLVSKEWHCLGDLLIKSSYGELEVDIIAVIGNHENLRRLVENFEIPFIFLSHEGLTRLEQDNKISANVDFYKPDYIVLAKYMRILTPEFVDRYPDKIINIHHSFLPAFVGARPYNQAYERGVKIIGATAHYVNHKLDSGPIITQDTVHVDHNYTAVDMMRVGRDIEKNVLNRALYQILTQRVFIQNNRTIVL
ncbi:formyltetrahydrofolate deformylase [Candidatus Erwinia haradaeae]|uniref:Formyltetrahydrofolate deformylase n=1 Tax=Candidatus Erwinia haradaeae TaxID=1922217 RepID=A0A451D3C4_9GAMM|nr:formyltetrahydrofolate deformylase [Candidatus Erwinia haradaeae]VFP80161.1 Formyltetrahydrofolate deformylase [Candidatus Erwinia haradaeae]